MTRSHLLLAALAAPLLGAVAPRGRMTTYRDTGCGCCAGWVDIARAAGYAVVLHDLERAARLRRFGLTESSAGCHTTQIDGYLIEGHVPLEVVARLLRERPKTRGIGIPGMPSGVAGMGGPRAAAPDVLTLDARPRVFARV
ncbi:MAG: DUF411 domain-containing protein [Vulcanimicrobiaceae bacterium]